MYSITKFFNSLRREPTDSECDAKCRVTYCRVCYYDDEYRPLHQNCKTCTRTEIEQQSKCFRRWTTCARRADGASYPKVKSMKLNYQG